jgi:hypothetical protein
MYHGHHAHSYRRNHKVDCAENQSVPPIERYIQGIADQSVNKGKDDAIHQMYHHSHGNAALPWGNTIDPII